MSHNLTIKADGTAEYASTQGEGEGRGAGVDGVKGTAWGFLNAVTEYADHHARATSDDNRKASAWFGPGDALKAKAAELLGA